MNEMNCVAAAALAAAVVGVAIPAEGQLFYIGVRGGAATPLGTFADSVAVGSSERQLAGASPGFVYGIDAGVSLGPLGLYGGIDRIRFECQPKACDTTGRYRLSGASAGLRIGIPLIPLVKPWVKAGLTMHQLQGKLGTSPEDTQITTKRTPGYELGAGVDIPVLGLFSLTPQMRYVGQKLDYSGLSLGSPLRGKRAANYYTFDIGFRLRSPL